MNELETKLREAIRISDKSPFYGVVISKVEAKRLLYRLIKEGQDPKLVYRKDTK